MRARPDPALGRLRTRAEFVAVARGARFRTERMSVQGLQRPAERLAEGAGLRLGFTVTKREGGACERNRIRRRLRAAAAESAGGFAALPVDVVVIGRRAVLSATFPTLLQDLARALAAVTRPRKRDAAAPLPATAPATLAGPHA